MPSPSLSIVKTNDSPDGTGGFDDADGSGDLSVGDTVTYTYTVTNTGTATLTGVAVNDDLLGAVTLVDSGLANGADVLAPGEIETGTLVRVLVAADLGATITNIATATSTQAPTVTDTNTITPPSPAMTIVKTNDAASGFIDADGSGDLSVGDTVTYTYTVTNTGTATLTGVAVNDDLLGAVTLVDSGLANGADVLAPGEIETGTLVRVLVAADLGATITNIATATSTQAPTVTDTNTITPPSPAMLVDKPAPVNADEDGSGDVSVGDTLTYTITATNAGTANLTNVVVSDNLITPTGGTTPCLLVIPGGTCTLIGTYVVTAGDVLVGSIDNTATAVSDQTPDATDSETVPVPQHPAIGAAKALTANADEDASGTVSLGDTLTYTITAINTGDVTLTNVTVDDTLTGAVDLPCAASLAPGASCAVAVLYVVTQADVDAGQILNTGTVDSNETPPVSDPEIVPVPQNPAIDVVKSQELTTDVNGDGQAEVGDVITYSYTVTNTGDVTLTDVALVDDVEGVLALSDVALDGVAVLAVGASETASSAHTLTQEEFAAGPVVPLPEIPGKLNAGDYVIFAQSRDGKAAETIGNGSNDAQASVSGSDNSLFGRIRSNADFSSSGQNIYYHYVGNGGTPSVPPDTLNDGKITYRFLNDNGDNFYETPLVDPQFTGLTDGTWLPVQSDVPVGPVAEVPLGNPYQYWPGNLHTVVTAASNYLQMDVAALEPFCDFGSLTGGPVEFDLTEADADGTYCTNGGVLKLSVQDVGTVTNPRSFTFLANDGLISISGQHAVIEPFALGVLAMSDLDSDSDQFPIKIAGSNFTVQSQSIVFAPMAGADVSGSDESLLCLHAIAQEVKLQGSNSEFGPNAPGCRGPVAKSLTNIATADGTSPTPVSVTVQATDTQTVVFFSENPSPLRAAAAASDGGMTGVELTPAMLQAAVVEGINYWRGVGIPAKRLDAVRQMDVRIADLPGSFLGFAYPDDIILIDRNAAGHGWSDASGALGAVAVRDVVTHELGHLLGFDHNDDGVMRDVLEVGVGTHPGRNRQSIMESRSQRQGQGGIH